MPYQTRYVPGPVWGMHLSPCVMDTARPSGERGGRCHDIHGRKNRLYPTWSLPGYVLHYVVLGSLRDDRQVETRLHTVEVLSRSLV